MLILIRRLHRPDNIQTRQRDIRHDLKAQGDVYLLRYLLVMHQLFPVIQDLPREHGPALDIIQEVIKENEQKLRFLETEHCALLKIHQMVFVRDLR
jgi:hypothetical protein